MRIVLLCILALACVACPQRYATRTVAVVGFTGDAQASANISTNSSEVQTALKIIDGVLASHGFAPTMDPNLTVSGALATYAKSTPEGLTAIDPCPSVSLKDGRLVFLLAERGGLNTDSKRILRQIRTELKSHYGTDRIIMGH